MSTSTPIFNGTIDYKQEIKTWDLYEINKSNYLDNGISGNGNGNGYHDEIKFKVNKNINSRLSIWFGDICSLNTDVIVYSNTTMISERDLVADKIFKFGGSEMASQITSGTSGNGEMISQITSGGNLPCRWVVHTVCPKFNSKYLSAGENALNSCYRSSFHLAMDQKVTVKSIGISCLHTEKRLYPSENGCHIACRTIRRLLEKPYTNSFERVILVVDSISTLELYLSILPMYFPRDEKEEIYSKNTLPKDIGDENGESIVEERKIRIIDQPSSIIREPEYDDCFFYVDDATTSNNGNSNGNGSDSIDISINGGSDRQQKTQFYKYDSIDRILNPFGGGGGQGGYLSSSPSITDGNSFTLKKEDPDVAKRRQFSKKSEKEIENEKLQLQFATLLTRSKVEDLSEITRLNLTHQTTDQNGKPIIVIIGSQLNSRKSDVYDRVLLYLIRVLEQTIQRGNSFSIIYFHSNMSSHQSPNLSWLKRLLEIFELKYKQYLHEFNIVHPTFLLKTTLFISKSILTETGVLSKIVYHENMSKISKLITKCNIPKSIFNYEFTKNQIDNFSFSFDNDVTL